MKYMRISPKPKINSEVFSLVTGDLVIELEDMLKGLKTSMTKLSERYDDIGDRIDALSEKLVRFEAVIGFIKHDTG